ncbi:hypothetical protein ACIPSJ_27565 [Streptomyces sp. NPDC090088]|uniref:hypothetical protein n=1 Tax=Streptomyces sp. NPDC090088 TaxID=3365944 RepID=UPI00381B2F4E
MSSATSWAAGAFPDRRRPVHSPPPSARRWRATSGRSWSSAPSRTSAADPLLSGFFVDLLGWNCAFWLNIPIGIVALVIGLKLPSHKSTKRIGRVGIIFISAMTTLPDLLRRRHRPRLGIA